MSVRRGMRVDRKKAAPAPKDLTLDAEECRASHEVPETLCPCLPCKALDGLSPHAITALRVLQGAQREPHEPNGGSKDGPRHGEERKVREGGSIQDICAFESKSQSPSRPFSPVCLFPHQQDEMQVSVWTTSQHYRQAGSIMLCQLPATKHHAQVGISQILFLANWLENGEMQAPVW